ncbi:hypothetical protein UFOVP1537_9 [uncultured Caudovirales phage]|uniref:Uncharacterized protein n=2 Tax=root TaxID=1 RepID=A0A6J5PMK0_9CAUD|nr:hypothetical protein UFOVP825_27 [uncultured Caudovirales phage]CAB4171186.1 hypothetical protein UFOVP915_9 [uncultured Caudovirales phage]CAB4177209.1 hypothetical protein UFOVP1000_26 [uncultured Caudovirales phage]CAB4182425.1 hypothetical protein UFOVP1092_1 [uncultured Caudovirales phage]CAB4187290.1 hypothetical protein UFOVP1152_5 [uncultured Caudovirales phage]
MKTQQWEDRGVSFVTETVNKVYGENNQSDKREVGTATIPMIIDLDKFRATYGDAYILDMSNGTSLRVKAQSYWRNAKNRSEEVFEIWLDATFRNARAPRAGGSTTVTVKVYGLPNGETYTGTNEVEYRSEYMAALVDAGTPEAVARTIALAMPW